MQQFPTIKENQIAILRAEYSTGHVLDEDLQLALHEGQIIYTVFNDLTVALAVSEAIAKLGTIECVIYDKNREIIKCVTPPKE